MTTIIETDPEVAELILQAVPGSVSVLTTVDELERHLGRDSSESAVVLGPSVTVDLAVDVAEWNRIARPSLGVVLVRTTIDSDVLARAMRSGVREVVPADDLSALGAAVRRVQAVARALVGSVDDANDAGGLPGGLVTVFSAKGGVGKTLMATNLGVALADLGHRVCIVDLDIDGGDVAVMLSLAPQHTLADLRRFSGDLDPSAVESLLTRHSDRVMVLAAPVHVGEKVDATSMGRVLEILKGMFDVVVVDTSGEFDDHALQAFDNSDLLVLVGTVDIPSLKNLKLAVGTLDLLNYPRDLWRLAFNRADPRIGLSVEAIEKTLGVRSAVIIPSSRKVLVAVNRGEPIVRANARHPVSRTITAFATSVSRDVSLPGRATKTRHGRSPRRAARLRKAV